MSDFAFPAAEFEGRLQRVRAQMKDRGLDALILTRAENIFYVSGFKASHFASWLSELHAVIVPAQGPPRLMTRALERETTKIQWTQSPRLYMDHEDAFAVLTEILRETKSTAGHIGIEERFLKVSQHRKLLRTLPEARFSDVSGLVEAVAALPSAAESACMRNAARITDIGFRTGIAAIEPGVYPYEVIGKVHDAMYRAGQSDFDMSLVCVWSGPQGGRMHDTTTTERIKDGDIVTIEIWGVDNQYKAGSQASIYVGASPPPAVAETHALVAAMHDRARQAVRAGVTAGEVFEAASGVYRAARGSDYYRRCGGSMGLTVFTLDLVKGRGEKLNPGVALLIQTLVDDPVLITCASTVMVTETGYDELTRAHPSLRARA